MTFQIKDLFYSAKIEKWWTLVITGLLLLFLVKLFYTSESSFDLGDGISHFQISKFSWLHPQLFLHSWGKPFFTLVSSIFSQFGLKGIVFFNCLCGVLTGYFAYLILKDLKVVIAWPVIFFIVFAPGYFPVLNSGLTEPLFGLMLLMAIYFTISKQLIVGALIISFLPFVRTEGYLIASVFAIYYLALREFKLVLILGIGTLLYAFIGYIVLNDFFWIISQNPYNGKAQSIYGSGPLSHFYLRYDDLMGKFILLFFFIGLGCMLLFKPSKKLGGNFKIYWTFFFLIGISFLVYFNAHVIMWWKGWANSLGLLRPIAAVLPCASLIAYFGFNKLLEKLSFNQLLLKVIIIVVGLFYVVKKPFTMYYFPFKNSIEQKVIVDVVKWLKENNFDQKKIYIGYPYLGFLLDRDVYDIQKFHELFNLKPLLEHRGLGAIEDNTIIVWDSHFGPECRISKEELNEIPQFEYLGTFNSLVHELNTNYGYFEMYVYRKTNATIKLSKDIKSSIIDIQDKQLKNYNLVGFNKSISDKAMAIYTSKDEYGPVIALKGEDISRLTKKIKFKTALLNKGIESIEVTAVMAIYDRNNKVIGWEGKKFQLAPNLMNNEFNYIEFDFLIHPLWLNTKGTRLEFYIWNNNKKSLFQQQLVLDYLEG